MTASKKLGQQTTAFAQPPVITGSASIVGPREGRGPLGKEFDLCLADNLYGEQTWEKAERRMLRESCLLAIKKAGQTPVGIDYMMAGDLLNQIISANFTARDLGIPFFGLYGACSTMFEGLGLGAMLVDGGFADNVLVAASSHYDTAERQYRFPTELGIQRPLTSQWTVTGAGALVLQAQGSGPAVTHATTGKVIDLGIKDVNDMGSAMAPAAADTIVRHFMDTGRKPSDYDLIITGDLASIGRALTEQLVKQAGYDISQLLMDLTSYKISPAHILVGFVTGGVILSGIGLYQPLVDFAGAGATVPLTGFGHLLAQGAIKGAQTQGILGAFGGGLEATLFNPRGE